jgi:hypothetical protein
VTGVDRATRPARAPDAHREGVRRHGAARGRDDHRRTPRARSPRSCRPPASTRPAVVGADGAREQSADILQSRPRSRRSRSTASGPTSGSGTAEEVALEARRSPSHESTSWWSRAAPRATRRLARRRRSRCGARAGTYNRAIARRRRGRRSAWRRHLTALRRTGQSASFDLSVARTLEQPWPTRLRGLCQIARCRPLASFSSSTSPRTRAGDCPRRSWLDLTLPGDGPYSGVRARRAVCFFFL